jgi:hypothetical protein
MFALGFFLDETYDEPGWSIEYVTDDFHEAVDNLFHARNDAAEGNELWEGAQLMILVLRDGVSSFEELNDGTRVE